MFKQYIKLIFSIILISLIIYSVKGYEIKLLSDENIISTGYVNNSFELIDNATSLIIGKVGYVVNKGYMDFNVSSIPDNSIIHNVSLTVYVDYSSLSTNRAKINSMEKPGFLWDNSSNIFYDISNGTTYNNSFKDFNKVGNKTIFLSDRATADLKNSLLSDVFSVGLLTKKDIANKYFRLNSSKADFGKPVLTVVYTIVNNLPLINQTAPATPDTIVEPNNESFSVNVSDADPDTLDISWYWDSRWVKSDSGVNLDSNFSEFNFTGNFTASGNYNISVNVSDGTVEAWYEWALTVSDDVVNQSDGVGNNTEVIDNETADDIIDDVNNTTNETNDTIDEDINNTANETDDESNETNDTIDEDINNTENESINDTIENETIEDFENETTGDVNNTVENNTESDVSNETNSSVDIPITNNVVSGGSGGGGGGGRRNPLNPISERKELVTGLTVLEGEVNVSINNEIINKITLFPMKNLENFDFNINKLSGKPEELPDLGLDVYSYVSLEKKGFVDEDLEKAEIFFRVKNEWLKDYNKETLKLYRYNGVRWDVLETNEVNSDEEFTYYKAITKGFSVFAIAAERVNSYQSEGSNDVGKENYKISKKGVFSLIGLILLVTLFVIFAKRKKKKKHIGHNINKKKNKLDFIVFPILILLFLFVVIQRKRETYFFDKLLSFFKQFFGFSGNTEVITTGFYNLNDVGGFLSSEFMLLFFVLIVIVIYYIHLKNK